MRQSDRALQSQARQDDNFKRGVDTCGLVMVGEFGAPEHNAGTHIKPAKHEAAELGPSRPL